MDVVRTGNNHLSGLNLPVGTAIGIVMESIPFARAAVGKQPPNIARDCTLGAVYLDHKFVSAFKPNECGGVSVQHFREK